MATWTQKIRFPHTLPGEIFCWSTIDDSNYTSRRILVFEKSSKIVISVLSEVSGFAPDMASCAKSHPRNFPVEGQQVLSLFQLMNIQKLSEKGSCLKNKHAPEDVHASWLNANGST